MPPPKLTWRSFLTVEPVIFLYAYGLFMAMPTFQQFVYYKLSEYKGFPYEPTEKAEKEFGCPTGNSTNATLKILEDEVQLLASRFDIGNVMCLSIPSIITSLLVGPWSDTGGRKLPLASPVIGASFEALNAIIVMYAGWPIYVLFVGSVVNGFCGFFTIMTQTAMSYIADTTPHDKVAIRMALMQLMILVGGLVSQLTSGLWIKNFGFIPPYWFIFACEVISALYVIFLVPESVEKPKEKEHRARFFSLTSLKTIWRVYKDPRDGYRRSLVLLLIGDGIVSLSTMGLSGVILLFVLRTPLCWSPTVLGVFMASRFLTQGIGGIVGIGVLKKCRVSEANITRIGLGSLIISLVLFAFSDKTWMVFLVPLVGCLNGMVSPVMKGMMSRITRPDERGAVFSAVAAISTLCNFAGAFFFNPIYIRSLKFGFPGLVFLISAVLALCPLIMMSFVRNSQYFEAPTSDTSLYPQEENKENNEPGMIAMEDINTEEPIQEKGGDDERKANENGNEKDDNENKNQIERGGPISTAC